MKRLANIALGLLASAWAAGQQKPMDQFVTELMGRMTLEEKIGQLNLLPGGDITTGNAVSSPLARLAAEGRLGAVLNVRGQEKVRALQQAAAGSRLGIPLLVGQDVIHGNRTVFPIPLAQSCTWDLEAIEQAARIAAKEATAQGINWIYSPMVDIGIDPRWGRVAEGAGEDPWLGSRIAQAVVRGYQGSYGPHNAMACVKHFALYGAAEAGRDYNTVDMSRTRMFNQYMQPYKAAVDAGAGSVMSSFNVVDGVPATCNKWLLDDLLRHKWRFGGFVVTDYESINEATVHGLGDQAVCAERALKAGTDMDMCSKAFADRLAALLEAGRISMADIDRACRRVLEAKYKLGLFDDPYRFCRPERLDTDIYTPEHRQAARRMAAESMVLLKNDAHTLPLAPQGRIALIGPLADNRSNMVGCWSTDDRPEQHSTLREAMERAVAGKAEVLYAQGCNIYADATTQEGATFGRPIDRVDDAAARAQALSAAAKADVIVCAMGEMAEMSGESSSRADLDLPDVQMALLRELVATGKPVVLLNFSGRPTTMQWEAEHVTAIVNVWFGGSEAADAICDVIFGKVNPSGRLTMTMPRTLGQIPVYYNHLSTGRPVPQGASGFLKYRSNYIDHRNDPLFPFGFGLSYTTFEYSDLTVSGNRAQVTVTNTGSRSGVEVVQLYVRDVAASIARPVMELRGFERIRLSAGQSRTVSFDISPDMLAFFDTQGNAVVEPGVFEIMVGPNSRDVLRATYELK